MGSWVKKAGAVAVGLLVLAGLASRRREVSGPPWNNPPGAGVREPRRPLQPSGSAAAAVEPPES